MRRSRSFAVMSAAVPALLMDLVFTIGSYALLAMAFNSFGLELDPGLSADDFERET